MFDFESDDKPTTLDVQAEPKDLFKFAEDAADFYLDQIYDGETIRTVVYRNEIWNKWGLMSEDDAMESGARYYTINFGPDYNFIEGQDGEQIRIS